MFTNPDQSTLSIAESAVAILYDDRVVSEMVDLNESPTMDYKDMARQAEKMSDMSDAHSDAKYHSKAAALHLDAARECGPSTGSNLYSKLELYHFAKSRYHTLRIDGMDQSHAQKEADNLYKELAQHKRVMLPTEKNK